MMFPSADPFAYPNQPMTTFENNHPQDFGIKSEASPTLANLPFHISDVKPQPATFSPGGMGIPIGPRRQNDNDVQLFGPMPMYLMQGAQHQGQRGFHPQQPNLQNMPMAGTPEAGGNMNFDDLFGGEEWANAFMDQGLGLSGGGSGVSGAHGFGSAGGPGMQNWR